MASMLFSWKRRMAAIPAAPACRQDFGVLQSDASQREDWDFSSGRLG